MDNAFKTAAYPGYTTSELRAFVVKAQNDAVTLGVDMTDKIAKFTNEIERREKVASGDRSVMTDGERLRHATREI